MTALHLLVYGETDSGVTDSIRIGMFREPLASLGVEVRTWASFADDVINGFGGAAENGATGGPDAGALRPTEALRVAGLTALAWSDVVLFRRWRPTRIVCTECETRFATLGDLDAHLATSGHRTMRPDVLLRPIVDLLETNREMLGARAVVYDTDDDVLDYPAWTGFAAAAARERDVVARIMGLADLVTTTTPVLAERLAGRTSAPVRVVRNAIEPAWYASRGSVAPPAPPVRDELRVVYHGVPVRLRDYEVARGAVDEVAREDASVRRVWLGATEEPRVVAAVDEVLPWVEGVREFAAGLTAARPDIGLAPLVDEPFNRAKSELHWLEYAMAGAPAVVSGLAGAGPYDVVRDGHDGLVAATPADWLRHLRALVASRNLREELAGRARERVISEYSVTARAPEWAEAYRWAAEHPRSGRGAAPVVVPGVDLAAPAAPVAGPEAAPEAGPEAAPSLAPDPNPALRVLVIGPGAASASDALRFEAMVPALAGRGVELRSWSPAEAASSASGDEFAALESALAWAGVVVLRRSYRTYHACIACPARTGDRAEIRAHAQTTGHDVVESPFAVVRPLVGLLEAEPAALGGRALVYDTDDDFFSADLPPGAEDLLERDLVERILRVATLVTTTTPVLAERLAARTGAPIRVIRNALDPAWYDTAPRPDPSTAPGDPRVVYHGVSTRLRDFELVRPALDALAAERPALRRVWLGSTAPEVAAVVDEARPWAAGLPEFAAALVAAAPDIGLAPIEDTAYNRARSELHWIEYALAGAPSIVSGTRDPGPYDVVRDGIDGLVARTSEDWRRHLTALAGSRDLRAEIAGRARERALAEYTVEGRSHEWAGAYQWAAEHV